MALHLRERDTLDQANARLDENGLRPRLELARSSNGPDAFVKISVDDRELTLPIWVRHASGYSVPVIANDLHRFHPARDAVLVMRYISPTTAKSLREHDVQFVDTAGNMYIRAPGVLLWVVGQRLAPTANLERPSRAFRRAGLQIIFGLLAQPGLARSPYREIADTVNVSLGSVPPVIQELRKLGYIVGPEGRRSLTRVEGLLTSWADAYGQTLRPKLLIDRFRADDPDWWRSIQPSSYEIAWGGETAAFLMTGHLTPEIVTIYAESLPRELIVTAHMRRDPAGNIDVRRRFWRNVLPEPRQGVVPAPLVYADLLAVGDARASQAAERVRETYLVRLDRP